MSSPTETVCYHAYYTGRVQGVGFRFTVERIAYDHHVMGWVKNLPDGRVELVAEGSAAEVEAFLAAVRSRFARNIRHEDLDREPATGRFTSFDIAT